MRRLFLAVALVLLASPSWAIIQYVGGQGAGFAGKTSATTVTFALTGGLDKRPAPGDLVMVSYVVGGTVDRTLTITNPSAVAYTYLADLYQNDTYDANMRVGYRFMPATPETTLILSQTFAITDAGRYTIHVFRGVDAGTPMDTAAQTAGAIDTRLANPAAITPSTSGAWIYVTGGAASLAGGTYTVSYLTALLAGSTADSVDAQIGSGYLTWTSGAYDPATFTGGGTDTTNDSWTTVTAALRPSTTGGWLYIAQAEATNSASGTTLDASSLDVASGDLLVGFGRYESGTPTTLGIADSDGSTNAMTCDAADERVAADMTSWLCYKIAATADATAVMRLTLGAAQVFRDILVLQFRPDAGETVTKDASNDGTGASGPIASGTITTTGTDEVAVGFASEFNASTATVQAINSIAANVPTNDPISTSTGFYRLLTATFAGGQASATVTTTEWTGHIMAFKSVAGGGPTCTQFITLMGVGC